jgi:hypothetical protein
LKVPRQCPFVLLVEVRLRQGKALRSEEGKAGALKFKRGRPKKFPALKVPRQCPFVLLVEVRLRQGKALRSEKGKAGALKFKRGRPKNFPALKVPRQCPFVPLVELRFRQGKALRSEKGKGLVEFVLLLVIGSEYLYHVERAALGRNVDVNIGDGLHVKSAGQRVEFVYKLGICSTG